MKHTTLKEAHELLGARMVPFAGWKMPVEYSGILSEVKIARSSAGLFDLGHMGRVRVAGKDAEPFLQRLQTNDVSKIAPGKIRYAMILDEDGKTQDDILVYREPDGDAFFVVINACNAERDLEIMHRIAADFADAKVIDQTDDLGMFAVQGPKAAEIVQGVTDIDLASMKYYSWARGEIGGQAAAMSRTGYTGEDGFEIYLPQQHAREVWDRVLEVGESSGLQACGLGARDILRLEAGMPLYGHEIDETTTPFDAGLHFAVKFTHDFVGREALEKIAENGGAERQLVGLTTTSRRVPRQGYSLWVDGKESGKVCSGGASPTLGTNIATGYLPCNVAPDATIEFAVRDSREPATRVDLPFYKRAR